MQRILQTVVTRLDWGEDGTHRLVLHDLPTAPAKAALSTPGVSTPMTVTEIPDTAPLLAAQAKQSSL